MPDPLDGLTPAQREVAAHRGGPLVVVGAAGTGKTRALLARHAWLASAGGLAPEQVLALTSSEEAADALRTGVEDELERGFEELCVHTVHGFGARLLRAAEAALAEERGATTFRLFTGHRSEGNLRLYHRSGYEAVGRSQGADGVEMIILEKPARQAGAYAATA